MEDDFAQKIFYYKKNENGKFCKLVNCNKKYVNWSRVCKIMHVVTPESL